MSDASNINRDYYEELAAGRADYWRKMAAPRQRVKTLLRELRRANPTRIVDLGCGNGAFVEELGAAPPGASLKGIDLSTAQIEANRRRLPQIAWHVHNLDRDSQTPEQLRESFDAVVAMELIEHLDHPGEILAAARNLVPLGDSLYLSTQSGRIGDTERRVGHRRHFERGEMQALLLNAGWS